MPIIGLFLGRSLGRTIGGAADFLAIAVLVLLALWMFLGSEEAEERRIDQLMRGHGFSVLALGVSISLDELAMGFTIGLLGLSIWLAIVLIGAQAFVLAQLGLRAGARIGEAIREAAERLAGLVLLGVGVLLLVEKIFD